MSITAHGRHLVLLGAALALPASASAEDILKIGTWNVGPGNATQDAGLTVGGKYVIKAHYDSQGGQSSVDLGGINVLEQSLQAPGNSLEVLVPMQGFGSSFVYHQDQTQHFVLPGVPLPTIQFGQGGLAPSNFVGVDFEGQFDSRATANTNGSTNLVEIHTEVASDNGIHSLNQVTQIVRCQDGAECNDIAPVMRSVNTLSDAVPLTFEAGADIVFSAANLTATTGASGSGNKLGAGRSDGQDFLSTAWQLNGKPLVGVTQADGFNLAVNLVDAGLAHTTDQAQWQATLHEDMTLLEATDMVNVRFSDTAPTVVAGASSDTNGVSFSTVRNDADLGLLNLIPDFETLTTKVLVDGVDRSSYFFSLIDNGQQFADSGDLFAHFGAGSHSLEVLVEDLAGASASSVVDFEVHPVPLPASGVLFGAALLGLARSARRRQRSSAR